MGRLNIKENIEPASLLEESFVRPLNLPTNAFNFEGSISFNKIALIYSKVGTTARTVSISFGLYSLNGSTLSLANSASQSSTLPSGNVLSWMTMATSATQDISPGDWFYALLVSTSGANLSFVGYKNYLNNASTLPYGGPFYRGVLSITTNGLPASAATSDFVKENSNLGGSRVVEEIPYIVISA